MLDCYGRLADLYHKHRVLPRPGEAARLFGDTDLFNTGRAAGLLFPPTGWRRYGAGAQVDYSLAPLPRVAATSPDMGMGGISLYREGKAPGDAWDFLKHLVGGARYARLIGQMPAPAADIEPWVREQLRHVPSADPQAMVKIVATATGNTRMAQHPRFREMQAVIDPAMTDLASGKVAAGPMLAHLRPRLQAILDAGPDRRAAPRPGVGEAAAGRRRIRLGPGRRGGGPPAPGGGAGHLP
jgi:hypothetical protein